ncbi:hypothetical protein V7654_11720 [Bacillus sp. JJ1609]|uniref:hypothetical protein n=1 Tax=Bacillus sp. JJ1609 TaxID=3122977 RepID=UPI002FFDDFD7
MKKLAALFCCLFFVWSSGISYANELKMPSEMLVEKNEKEGVFIYATPFPKDDLFRNFRVEIGKAVVEPLDWQISMREERRPELHVIDLNDDGKKEVVVILTLGTGTWVVQKEAHILQEVETANGKAFEEIDIDNPVHTIQRDFRITATDKKINVEGRGHTWEANNLCGKTDFKHRFPLHQSVNWKVEGNTLNAHVGLTLTDNCVPGAFILKYKQKGEMYIAEQIIVNL